jgi:acyl carrier protein
MTSDTIEAKVKDILLELLDTSEEKITPSASLINDLGASSVDLVEILAELENEFDVNISDEEAEGIRTVQSILDYVQSAKS